MKKVTVQPVKPLKTGKTLMVMNHPIMWQVSPVSPVVIRREESIQFNSMKGVETYLYFPFPIFEDANGNPISRIKAGDGTSYRVWGYAPSGEYHYAVFCLDTNNPGNSGFAEANSPPTIIIQ